ncbi:MAG: cell division protein FtsQ/DivIB [Methyloligellaceae bacterium]
MQPLSGKLGRLFKGRTHYGHEASQGEAQWTDESGLESDIALSCSQRWQGRSQKFGCRTPLRIRICGGRFSERPWQAASGLFICATLFYGLAVGGYVDRTMALVFDGTSTAAAKAGFTVQRLTIEGQRRASDRELVRALGVGPGVSILSYDTGAAQKRLEQLPWVRHAKIMRLLPSTLHVVIDEREPFAVWQIKGQMRLIDSDGAVVSPLAGSEYARLPLVVGEGAGKHAADLMQALAHYARLKTSLRAAVRVADRRWNLKLRSGMEIRLPEQDVAMALEKLAALEDSHRVLASAVVSIDLRLADRVTLRLTKEAATELDLALSGARTNAGRDT